VPAHSQEGPQAADRIVIRYANGAYELLSTSTVVKVLPPADELPAARTRVAGFWYEIQSAAGEVRYRRTMRDPVRLEYEWPAAGSAPMRVTAVPAERVFAVLAPHAAPGDEIVLFGSSVQADGRRSAATEVARMPLTTAATP
jgi:hypothetical protein